MQLGAKHVESPFIEFGQISTVLYFAHFIFIVPFVSLIENTLIDLNTFKISIIKPFLGTKGIRYFHATKSLSVYEGIDIYIFTDACINFYTVSKICYYQAIAEYANLKIYMFQYGHTVPFAFNTDITILENVKEIAAQKFDVVVKHVNDAQEAEENGRAMLRGLHRKDVTNANRTSLTSSITEMHIVKFIWNLVNGS